MDIISVVLGADTKKDRTRDSIKLIEYAFASYQMIDVSYMVHNEFDTLVESTKFDIVKGINNNLSLDLSENDISLYPVNKNDVKEIKVVSEVQESLHAPINTGDKIRKNLGKYRR